MNFQVVLIIGIAGCYFIGVTMEGLALRGSEQWVAEERQRVAARQARYEGLLRLLDLLGMALIVMGLLRLFGALRFIPLAAAPRILVAAVPVLCLERIVRGWVILHALRELKEQNARARGLLAVWIGTLLQVALALWVGWWVCMPIKPPGGGGTTAVQTPTQQTGTDTAVNTPPKTVPTTRQPYLTEAEALELLGKVDPEYLRLLVPRLDGMYLQPTRIEKNGQTLYRRDNLENYKTGGLPTLEELRATTPTGQQDPQPPAEATPLRE